MNQQTDEAKQRGVRVAVFVDFWNFQIALNEASDRLRVDWVKFPTWLAQQAYAVSGLPGTGLAYEGAYVYLSFNPRSEKDRKLKHWALTVLDRFPGVSVICLERKPKNPPKCQECHAEILNCPACGAELARTGEKGIDTSIVTDMIRLAWEEAYDVAVLVSADHDFVPAVEFLHMKGRRVVHAGFPPAGMALARKCWASIDLSKHLHEFERQT